MAERGAMRDRDVRAAVHRKVLQEHHGDPNTLVVEELGLQHGRSRIDIAVINGEMHGYELKSDLDTLLRLPAQSLIYNKIFDKVTIVIGEKHLSDLDGIVPRWWGVKIVSRGARGAIHPKQVRPARRNPSIDPKTLAQLLWRQEAIDILNKLGVPLKDLNKNRSALYDMLSTTLTLDELRRQVRETLKAREKWRGPLQFS